MVRVVQCANMFGYAMQQPMMGQPVMMQQDPNGGYYQQGGKGKGKGGGRNDGVCDQFERNGTCRFGDTCRFEHKRGGTKSTGTKVTSKPKKSAGDIPDDLVIDWSDHEEAGTGAKAILWATKPVLRALNVTKENSQGEKIAVNKAILCAGVIGAKMQQIALHVHTMAKDGAQSELGFKKADELCDELLVICKKKAPHPYRLSEADAETQAVKDELADAREILKDLATTAKKQQERLNEIEVQHRVAAAAPPVGGPVFGNPFGDGGSHVRMGTYSPGDAPTPMGRRPRKYRGVRRVPGSGSGNTRGVYRPQVHNPNFYRAFGDGAEPATETESSNPTTPVAQPGGGGPVGGPVPRMPNMGEATVADLCNDPVRRMLGIPDESMGWRFAEELTVQATTKLGAFKKVKKADEDPFLETTPLGDKYNDLLPLAPVQPGGVMHQIQLEDLGRLATIFVPLDFSAATDIHMGKILDKIRVSQAPLKRIGAILLTYGIEMKGLPSFKLGLMVLALSMAKDRRTNPVPAGVASSSSGRGVGPQ